jgi:hypothetical protein
MFRPKRISINIPKLAEALGFSIEETKELLASGNESHGIVKRKVCQAYDLTPVSEKGFDAKFINERIAIRALTGHGIKFQHSSNIGSGRTCHKDDLLGLSEFVDWIFVVDIRTPSDMRVTPVAVDFVIGHVAENRIKVSGVDGRSFYRLVSDNTVLSENVTTSLRKSHAPRKEDSNSRNRYPRSSVSKFVL